MRKVRPCGSLPPIATSTVGRWERLESLALAAALGPRPRSAHSQPSRGRVLDPVQSSARALDWTGSNTLPRLGWEWALLGLGPNAAAKARDSSRSQRPTVLVAMGGSDPHGLTLRMAKALSVLDQVFRVRFVIGTGMKDAEKVARGLVMLKK